MDNNQLSYQNLVERFRTAPVLENPEELTQAVIERIEQISTNKLKNKIMYITSIVSGVAAALLFCLLIHETIQSPVNHLMGTGRPAAFSEQIVPGVRREINVNVAVIVKEKMEMKNMKKQFKNKLFTYENK
jgi:hypothetical protein